MNQHQEIRADHSLISSLVNEGAAVLDIGCGDGALLAHLRDTRAVRGFGLEIDPKDVTLAVTNGLSVVQGDADADLNEYPDNAFDVVILSNSLQALRYPDQAIIAALRVGRRVIVSFPNFGHWRVRRHLLWHGTMPISDALPAKWYETPNIHLCTISDFIELSKQLDVTIEACFGLYREQSPRGFNADHAKRANLFAEAGLFVLSQR